MPVLSTAVVLAGALDKCRPRHATLDKEAAFVWAADRAMRMAPLIGPHRSIARHGRGIVGGREISGFDEHVVVFQQDPVSLDRNHAGRSGDLAGANIKLAVVKIAFDLEAVEISLRQ